MTTHPCGCVTAPHPEWGVTHAVSKCDHHVAHLAAQPTGEAYYRTLGVFDEAGNVRHAEYVAELESALGVRFPPPVPEWNGRRYDAMVEVGCGVSPYVRAVEAAGYDYLGSDTDEWATARTLIEGVGRTSVSAEPFDGRRWADNSLGLVLSAHCAEHVPDAPAMLAEFRRILVPGGSLVLVVPDDTDLTNPDHRWFFSAATLARTLVRVGFEVPRLAPRRVVPHELFLYCLARKPS